MANFRVLVVIDEYSRECLALHVARTIRAEQVMHVLADLFLTHGRPDNIRSDNDDNVRYFSHIEKIEVARQVGQFGYHQTTTKPTWRAKMEAIRTTGKKKVPVIAVDEEELRTHVSEVVRQCIEETLNGLLDAEADALCQARRYERNAERASTRAGHYERNLQTKAGTFQLKVPKLRHMPFETAIIERYRRRESSVEEALVEMYLAGVSVRRVEDITEALWGSRVSPSTISDLNQKIFEHVEEWRNRPLEPKSPYIFVDGI